MSEDQNPINGETPNPSNDKPQDSSPETQEIPWEEKLDQMKNQWLRAEAEIENLRRRHQKEKEEALRYGLSSFGKDLISVYDNLERALEYAPKDFTEENESLKSFINGIEMTHQELHKVFDRHGIKKIYPSREPFDPHIHQAMFEVEDDSTESGIVLQVLQCGFMLNERLLRPALVGVSKAKS